MGVFPFKICLVTYIQLVLLLYIKSAAHACFLVCLFTTESALVSGSVRATKDFKAEVKVTFKFAEGKKRVKKRNRRSVV